MTKDALLEIGHEEMPAAFVRLGMDQLRRLAETSLREHRLGVARIETFGTPRRLAVLLHGVAAQSESQSSTVSGPPADKARDAAGQWTPAAIGFARKHGLKPEALTIENSRLCAAVHEPGLPAKALLSSLFSRWIAALDYPKSMVWEPSQFRFPRPIRWLVGLIGNEVVPLAVAGVRSGRFSRGLVHYSSKKVPLTPPGKYLTLLKNECVLADPEARQTALQRMAEQAVKKMHARPLFSASLLTQVADLVEHPVAVVGRFAPSYLDLPPEVLRTCLEHHQKFFPVADEKTGALQACFIGIRNGVSIHQDVVREGYERVLAARLADARFFFAQDRRTPLADKVERLRGVVFQEKLGTLFDKKERVQKILEGLARGAAWLPAALRAAELCKADLVTEMVGEFPELQGAVGRIYAQADGEPAEVAQAIEEHYWPVTLAGDLPGSDAAAALSLADRLDTLAGDFAVGIVPSGSADPHGLRRAAVGVLRILEARAWRLTLEEAVLQAVRNLPADLGVPEADVFSRVMGFLKQRQAALWDESGFRVDEVEAVLAMPVGEIAGARERLEALHGVRNEQAFIPLWTAFKRAKNILQQAQKKGWIQSVPGDGASTEAGLLTFRPDSLKENEEKQLWSVLEQTAARVESHVSEGRYADGLKALVILREPLDAFFDKVMVNAEDETLRLNRLALMDRLVALFSKIADLSKLQNA